MAVLDHVAATWPTGHVRVVLNNVGDHTGHVARRWWVAHQDRIRPLWRPTDRPDRNRMERVWRPRKDTLANHRCWADFPALERPTASLLDRLEAHVHRPDGIHLRPVHTLCHPA